MSSFPTNVVVFQKLAELDFLATLSLTDVSSSLRQFILDEIVSVALLVRFLRENQCSFLNDIHHRNFSNNDFTLLVRAFTALRRRMNDDDLYQNVKDYLAPLIWCSPRALLFNREMHCDKTVWETLSPNEKSDQLKMHAIYTNSKGRGYISLLNTDEMEALENLYNRIFSNFRDDQFDPIRHFYDSGSTRISILFSPHRLIDTSFSS